MTTLSAFIGEHFHVPPIGRPALICNRCGRDDIDAVTVHMENDHGIDTADVDVDPARRERCWLTTDHHGRRLPTDQLVENVLLAIFDRLFDLTERITAMTEQQTHLDSDVQALGAAEQELVQVITDLKAAASANQPLDFTAADALVAKVSGDAAAEQPQPAPADSVPTDTAPANPVDAPAASGAETSTVPADPAPVEQPTGPNETPVDTSTPDASAS